MNTLVRWLAELQRRDFLPTRKKAKLRALDVRHGLGDCRRRVKLSRRAAAAIVRWDRERANALGPTNAFDGQFVTLGTRRRDGTDNRAGGRCGQAALAEVGSWSGGGARLTRASVYPSSVGR